MKPALYCFSTGTNCGQKAFPDTATTGKGQIAIKLARQCLPLQYCPSVKACTVGPVLSEAYSGLEDQAQASGISLPDPNIEPLGRLVRVPLGAVKESDVGQVDLVLNFSIHFSKQIRA